MINLLTKTVTFTVKELLVGAGVIAGTSMVVTGGLMFGRCRRKTKSAVNKQTKKLQDKLDTITEINNKNEEELINFKSRYGGLLKKMYLSDIMTVDKFIMAINSCKIDDTLKLALINDYADYYKNIDKEDNIRIAEYKDRYVTYMKILLEYNNLVVDKNEKDISLFAKMAIEKNKAKEVERAKAEAEAKERKEREHELALKREDNKKYEDYLKHIENIKQMEVDSQNLKTTAFASVAKGAIDNFGKKKDEE